MIEPGMLLEERFQIEKMFAEGGMGRVWLAYDQSTNREHQKVIIKELKDEFTKSEIVLEKFYREILALKKIDHPHVVKFLYEGKQPSGSPYLAIEFIDGKDLRKHIVQGGIVDLARVADLFRQFAAAIDAAHAQGIYHRDLKPENIMVMFDKHLGEELVKVIDFGIATVKARVDEATKTTLLAGTVDYMSPEQIMGKPSAATDIYALGVIAYEMVTGAMPFNVRTVPAPGNVLQLYALQQRMPDSVVPPKALRRNLPTRANELIMQALSFDPKARPSSAKLFGEQLAEALVSEDDEPMMFPIAPAIPGQTAPTLLNPSQQPTLKAATQPTSVSQPQPPAPASGNNILMIIGGVIVFVLLGFGIMKMVGGTTPIPNPSPSPSPSLSLSVQPLLLNYSYDLSEWRGGKYAPPTTMAGQEIIFHDRDLLRFSFTSKKTGYIYVINESPEPVNNLPKYTILYPVQKDNNLMNENQTLILPATKEPALEFSGPTGTEKLWLVFAREKIAFLQDLTALIDKQEKMVVTDRDKIDQLQKLLNNTKPSKAEKDDEKNLMDIRSNGEKVTVTPLKLQHS